MFQPQPVSFFGSDASLDLGSSDVVLFGAPHGVPYPDHDWAACAGAANALRRSFGVDAEWTDHWDFDLGRPFIDSGLRFMDAGDIATIAGDGDGNRAKIRDAAAASVAAGAAPMMIGGDDSVPIPFIEALAPLGPLTIVQIDAHIDWREDRYGERFGFSSTMRRASEMAHVERIVHVGIRGVGSARRGEVEAALDWGAKIVTAGRIHREGVAAALDEIPEGAACAVTIDCDALDPSFMPAVLAPTPGGLTYTQTADLFDWIATKARIAAFDLIEFAPARDPSGVAAYTAARLLTQAVGRIARRA